MKKSLRPQQTAPVQRENTASAGSRQQGEIAPAIKGGAKNSPIPFAGDDAE